MAIYYYPPPPPWWEGWTLPSPPPPPPPPPTPTKNSPKPIGGIIAGVSIAAAIALLFITCMCSLCKGHRESRANAEADAAAAAAALALRSPSPERTRHDEEELRGSGAAASSEGHRPWRGSPTAGLPSFTYSRPVKHNVTDAAGEEAAACSVCLGAFQRGETVRLLPVCLHLYHVECIDPWLEKNATCPVCRSGTDVEAGGGVLPPV
ncbi:hypothetical protein ACP4OV_012942 [Aristida adscensionis]